MRKALFAAAGMFMLAAPSALEAQERAVDGALGALAGAVVAGPVGLVAGVFVGATAGPSISSSWGLRHHRYHRVRYVAHPQRQ